jgi:hypothetical protein
LAETAAPTWVGTFVVRTGAEYRIMVDRTAVFGLFRKSRMGVEVSGLLEVANAASPGNLRPEILPNYIHDQWITSDSLQRLVSFQQGCVTDSPSREGTPLLGGVFSHRAVLQGLGPRIVGGHSSV